MGTPSNLIFFKKVCIKEILKVLSVYGREDMYWRMGVRGKQSIPQQCH